jgi:hypothetical protein
MVYSYFLVGVLISQGLLKVELATITAAQISFSIIQYRKQSRRNRLSLYNEESCCVYY